MRALEFFLLRDASRAAAALGEERRRAAADALDASTRDASQAASLLATGARAQAYRYAASALGHALDAARRAGLRGAELGEALAPLVGDRWADRIERADDASRLMMPRTDDDLADHHGQLYEEMLACARHLVRALEDRTHDPAWLERARRVRAAVALGVAALGVAFLVYELRFDPTPFTVSASGYRTGDIVETWPPENAADRDEMSYWHLPAGETGWIELALSAPRDVEALRVMNAHDVHADDQNRYDRRRFDFAARLVHVRAYAGDREVAHVERELRHIHALDRETIPLEARGVDRIRIEIESFYGQGAGLAEVEVLP